MMRLGRPPRIGIALGRERLVAVMPRGRRLEATDVGELPRAFAELRQATGYRRAVVTVALVPPLVELRGAALPPLRDDERREVLARDAARYFIDARGPQVVGTATLPVGMAPASVLAAAAPAGLIEDLEAACFAVGWTLAAIVPAHAAWTASVRARRKQYTGTVVVRLPEATEVLRLDGGRLVERRRVQPRNVRELAHPTAVLEAPETDPVVVAAEYAPHTAAFELCSSGRHTARRRLARRVAASLAAVAVACLVVAAVLDFWGRDRELSTLRARRAALAPQVAAAMRARDSLGALTGRVAALRRFETTGPQWSAFLTDLAEYLPRDAHVVALRGASDSVVIEGVARQAVGVFQAVQQIPHAVAVRAAAPIRQDAAADGTVREQFVLATTLRAPVGPQAPRRAP
jgi:hypothetical protein